VFIFLQRFAFVCNLCWWNLFYQSFDIDLKLETEDSVLVYRLCKSNI